MSAKASIKLPGASTASISSSFEWAEESTDFSTASDVTSTTASVSPKAQRRASKIRKDHRRIQKIRREIKILRTRSNELKGKEDTQSQEELETVSGMEGALEDMKYLRLRNN